jgi:hypothetical protein
MRNELKLSSRCAQVDTYRKAELIHARWAMVATIGCFVPEAANAFGDGTQITGAVWWQVRHPQLFPPWASGCEATRLACELWVRRRGRGCTQLVADVGGAGRGVRRRARPCLTAAC